VGGYKDGVPVADCLMEAAAWRYTVRITCQCGHFVLLDPHALWWLYERKGGNPSFREMRRRYFCSRCYLRTRRRVRPTIVATGHEEPTVKLELPPDEVWRKAQQRFR
jgi:hypothetical protein